MKIHKLKKGDSITIDMGEPYAYIQGDIIEQHGNS